MGIKIELPGEIEMVAYINKQKPGTLRPLDVGRAFLDGDIDEFEYRQYLDDLSNLYIIFKNYER